MGKLNDERHILSTSTDSGANGRSSDDTKGETGPYSETNGPYNKHRQLESESTSESDPQEQTNPKTSSKNQQSGDAVKAKRQKEHGGGSESSRDRKSKSQSKDRKERHARNSRERRGHSRDKKKRSRERKKERDMDRRIITRIGVAQIFCGAVCAVLGGGCYTTNADAAYIQAFVAGGLLVIAGVFGLIAGRVKAACVTRTYLYLTFVALVLGAVSLLLSGLTLLSIDLSRAGQVENEDQPYRNRVIIYSLVVATALIAGFACIFGIWASCTRAYPKKRTGKYLVQNIVQSKDAPSKKGLRTSGGADITTNAHAQKKKNLRQ